MRRALPLALLAAGFTLASTFTYAQNDHFAYAITDLTKEGAGWNALRKIDLQTGQYSNVLLNGIEQNTAVYDAVSKKQLTLQADARYGTALQTPFSSGVAAAAYDKKHNRLYFTPMFIDQLRYIDLRTMKVYYVTDQPFTKKGNMHNDEGKIITRMVIAPDGNGYAISNDAQTFIRFTTGRTTKIEQLGLLVDDPANGSISVDNRCSSWGGDMISDDKGTLYILTARNSVFKVNTENKVATYLGNIKGLAPTFTVNGAVVDGDGKLLVSSAVDATSYFTVDPQNWTATAYTLPGGMYRSSDLANSNYLSTTKRPTTTEITTISRPEEKFSKQITVYPNPVTENRVVLQFHKVANGEYTIELNDVLGRSVKQQKITINAEDQTQVLTINKGDARGIYLVKVLDNSKQSVFTQKVVVQ